MGGTNVTSRTINSLRLTGDNTVIRMASATDRLTVGSGGMLFWINGTNTMMNGELSAGQTPGASAELFLHVYNTTTINSQIVDNAGGAVTLVKSFADSTGHTGTLNLVAANTYSGGTFVNSGAMNLAATTPGIVTVPYDQKNSGANGLVISAATVTMQNFPGQIDPRNSVTLNGNSTLNLVGANTLASLTFNTSGGVGNPTVNVDRYLALAVGSSIAVQNDNANNFANITGTSVSNFNVSELDLSGNNNFSITVNGVAPVGLRIDSAIRNGGIVKNGTGTLALNNAYNVFAGGLTVNGGTLMVGGTGALGTGPVTMADNTTISAAGRLHDLESIHPQRHPHHERRQPLAAGPNHAGAEFDHQRPEPVPRTVPRPVDRHGRTYEERSWHPVSDGCGRRSL